MLTGSAAVSFHGSDWLRASYVRTEAVHRLFNQGLLKGLLLGQRPQPAQRPVLRHPDRAG